MQQYTQTSATSRLVNSALISCATTGNLYGTRVLMERHTSDITSDTIRQALHEAKRQSNHKTVAYLSRYAKPPSTSNWD